MVLKEEAVKGRTQIPSKALRLYCYFKIALACVLVRPVCIVEILASTMKRPALGNSQWFWSMPVLCKLNVKTMT